MIKKYIIIGLLAVMLVTFTATSSVNANPVIVAAIPFAIILTGLGFFGANVHDANESDQMAKAPSDDNSEELRVVVKAKNEK